MVCKTVCLSDVCELIAGFAFKSKDFGNYSDKVIKIAHITPPIVNMENLPGVDISMYSAEKLNKYIASKGDFVLAMTGATIGKIGRVEAGNAYINQRVLMFKNHDSIDKDYLYYVLQQYEFEQYVLSHIDSQSAQPNISANTIGKFSFMLPEVEIQKKVGRVLRTFDALQELNQQINRNLQNQVLALYGQFIGNCKEKYNGIIGDYCSVKSGFAFKSSWWQESGTRVIKIGTLGADYLNLNECSYVSADKEHYASDFKVKGGDLLIAMTGATIGKFAIVPNCDETLLVNQRVGKFFLSDDPLSKVPFLYCTLKQPKVIAEIINRGQGSAQPNISVNDIMTTPCIMPDDETILYHATTGKRAVHILQERCIKKNAPRYYTKKSSGSGYSTQGFVYLSPEITYSIYFANCHNLADQAKALYIFRLEIPEAIIEPDYDELRIQGATQERIDQYGGALNCSLEEYKSCRVRQDLSFDIITSSMYKIDLTTGIDISELVKFAGCGLEYVRSNYTPIQANFIKSICWEAL